MKRYILSLLVLIGILNATCIRDDINEVVSCSKGKLMWQDNSDANTTKKMWKEAIRYCENLTLANHNDWRLPNINELESLVDYKKFSGTKMQDGFINKAPDIYWSSTSGLGRHIKFGWWVYFGCGYGDWSGKTFEPYYVRCVRDE